MRAMKERTQAGSLLSKRFRHVLLHLAEAARRELDSITTHPVRSVHSLRTRMKNLLALLPLVKPRIPKPQRKAVANLAGALKDAFSAQRDTHVLDALRAKVAGRRKTAPKQIPTPQSAATNTVAKADASRLIRIISKAGLRGLTWAEVADGYLQTYRAGRKAMKACERKPSGRAFHKWRRAVKDFFYQSQVLQPLEGMKARSRSAGRLSDRLGMLNDLRLLHAESKKSRAPKACKHIAKKQRALRTPIFKVAGKLFRERPREIARELGRCLKFHPAIAAQAVRQT